ncbi:MAG: OsmC family protein [Corynebacterium glucuronolyticum]|nr:OsmC family protein [Corynebacterium glucuronolyticum]
MTEKNQYAVDVVRVAPTHYRATNAAGASIEFGKGEGLLNPVELLLAAVAGCSSIDVDVVTSRRAEPETFLVHAEGSSVAEDGASRLSDVHLNFHISFSESKEGQTAQSMVERLVQLSHDKNCTVSRTVELPTNVDFTVE